jgi:hypothetical protein
MGSGVRIQWGDIPTWVSAICTIALVASAIWAGRKARDAAETAKKIYDIEKNRDITSQESATKLQASQIAAWTVPSPKEMISGTRPVVIGPGVDAVISNPTSQAIYDVDIAWWHGSGAIQTNSIDLVPPMKEHQWSLTEGAFEEIKNYYENVNYISSENDVQYSEWIARKLRIYFSFTDSQGLRWRRDHKGKLRPDAVGSAEVPSVETMGKGEDSVEN